MVINSLIKNKNLNFFKVTNPLSQINFLMTNSQTKINHFTNKVLIYLCMEKLKSLSSKLFYMDVFLYILPNNKFLHVAIMNEFWNQDRIKMYDQWLTEHDISHTIDEIDYSQRIREDFVTKGTLDFERIQKSS
jgi:hypothetical protein